MASLMTVKNTPGTLFLRPFRAQAILLAVAALSLSMTACRRDEVTHARVKKEQPFSPTTPASMSGMAGDVPPPPAPGGGDSLQWKLPKGWQESKAGGMRFATLKPPVNGKLDVSVVVLPGTAGGELANVNRWRGQIGLPPVDDAALASARKAVKSRAGTISVYDFTSDGTAKTRMIAGLMVVNGNSWFLKMVGDADAVASARGGFLQLLETLHLE